MQKCVQHTGVREFGWIKAPDGLERAGSGFSWLGFQVKKLEF